jgi:hypothetical protein
MTALSVSLAAEGSLDEQVLRQLLQQSEREIFPVVCYGKHGRDHLKQNVPGFNEAARSHPFIVLADLEDTDCAPGLLQDWLPHGRHANLVLRIAVRMVESWLLADRQEFAKFLGVPMNRIPIQPDTVDHPKRLVVQIARHSRIRAIREDLVPTPDSTSQVGRNYVGQMIRFALERWQVKRALEHSPSLERALRAVQNFTPHVQP